jgi:DNA-binding NarL/FixJ family response regulator
LAAVGAAVDADAGAVKLLVVRGPTGIGKTALLTSLRDTWGDAGMDVITVRCRDAVESWDLFGARTAISAVREHFDRIGDLRLADAIKQASELCRPETYRSERGKAGLLVALARMFACVQRNDRVALLIDDVDAVSSPALLLAPACRVGYLVVAACRDDGGPGSAPWVVGQLADTLIDLPGLPDESISALVTRLAGAPIDESVLPTLRTALGSLLGNPGSLMSVLDSLRRDGRLVVVQGALCIKDGAPIALPADHELVERVRRLDEIGRDLVTMVASSGTFTVDDLLLFAPATGRSLTAYGHTADQLISSGVLSCDPSGRLECVCPALATAILAGVAEDSVRRLHRRFAEIAIPGHPGLATEDVKVADHIVAADRALPAMRAVADLLVAEADRVAASDPARAAAWYRAALRHAGDEHPEWSDLLLRLLRTLIRGGCYEILDNVVREVVTGRPASDLRAMPHGPELALAAALAALHTGRAVPGSVRTVLAAGNTGPIASAAQWLESVDPPDVDVFLADFAALSSRHPMGGTRHEPPDAAGWRIPAASRDEIVEAAAIGDLVTVFVRAFPEAYGKPSTGPLALHHRLVRAYATAAWPEALSYARQLELTGRGETTVHRYARLVAAEICAASGQFKQAGKWLAEVPSGGSVGAQRDWLEATLLVGSEGSPAALAASWSAYQRARRGHAATGWERRLLWFLCVATSEKQPEWVDLAAAEIESTYRQANSRLGRAVVLLARGMMHRDRESLELGVELVRQFGFRYDQVLAYSLAAAGGEAPEYWARAYDIANEHDLFLRFCIRKLMQQRGVSVSEPRGPRMTFSETELRIIELIGDGRTNRQIAQEIRMSVKTVENYITRLFAKTGCRSRLDLAAASLKGNLAPVGA